jgi:hypothetical protein
MFHYSSQDCPPPTSSVVCGFQHEWRVHVSPDIEYEPSDAPEPFEAYGKHAHFVLVKCLRPSCKDCIANTKKEACKLVDSTEAIFDNYNVLFGIKRNKALSIQVKKNKLQEMEEESSSEEEIEEEEEEIEEEEDEEIEKEEEELEVEDDEEKEEEEESEESEDE